MSARSPMIFLSAMMLAGCAVPDVYSIPDLVRSKAPGGKGSAVDSAPVLFVLDGENGPNSCDFRPRFIYQPDVPEHRISFTTSERHGETRGAGSGDIGLPETDTQAFSFEETADGHAYLLFGSTAAVSCDQVQFQIDIKCERGRCPPYAVGERSDRGGRVPLNPVLTTSF